MSLPPSPMTMSSGASPISSRSQARVTAVESGPKPTTEALKRKRQRDKESQRRKRQRERQYTADLERKIQQLEHQLTTAATEKAQQSNIQLPSPRYSSIGQDYYARSDEFKLVPDTNFDSEALSGVSPPGLALTDDPFTAGPTNSNIVPSTPSTSIFSSRPLDIDVRKVVDDASIRVSSSSPTNIQTPMSSDRVDHPQEPVVSFCTFEALLTTPEWMRLPVHNFSQTSSARPWIRGDRLGPFIQHMRSNPDIEALCPPQPKTIDILFGGSKNVLANLIVTEVAKEALLPPEKFAISWVLYLYCKWLIWPSEESFSLLPSRLRPTARQLAVKHPWCIDIVPWPEMRDKLITNGADYDIDEVLGLLLCTYRIRGSFNSNFIKRENGGELQVDPDFYNRFMNREGWGILERFWLEYEDLVSDLDPGVLIREDQLIAM